MVHLINIAYGVGCGIVSAGIAFCSKLMTPSTPALVKVFLRFLIGAICLVPFLSPVEFKKVTKKHLLFFGAMGLTLVVIFNLLFFSALKYIAPMTSALILSAQPIITLITSALLFKHMPSNRLVTGFVITISGVAVVITKGQLNLAIFSGSIGEFLMLAAVSSQVIYTLLLRNMSNHFSARFIAFAVSISGLLFLLPLIANRTNFNIITKLSLTDWLCMSYIGIAGTTIGVVLFSLAVKHLGPALGSLIVFSTLPIATMFYSSITGNPPNNLELVGGLCILIGLVFGLGDKKNIPTISSVK